MVGKHDDDRSKAIKHAQKGMKLLHASKPDKAIDEFTKALELAGDDFYCYFDRGEARTELEPPDWKGALADFEKAAKIAPDDLPSQGKQALEMRLAMCRAQAGEANVSIKLAPHPKHAGVHVLAITGALRTSEAGDVAKLVKPLEKEKKLRGLVVDCRKLAFLGSGALAMFVKISSALHDDGAKVILAGASPMIVQLVTFMGMTVFLGLSDDVESACAELRG